MKITNVEAVTCDAGWRPWIFVRITTDTGIIGYGECSDNRSPRAVLGCVEDFKELLIGRDPRHIEMLYWDMYRQTRHSTGGVVQKGIAGINCALWDITAKELGVPVYALFGGPTRDKVRLYWTHCGSYRVSHGEDLGTPPIKSLQDISDMAKEVVSQGFSALKTNAILIGDPSKVLSGGFGGGYGSTDRNPDRDTIRSIETLMRTFREAVGDGIDIAIDLNFNFTTEGFVQMLKVLQPYDLAWVEMDIYDPHAMLQVKQTTKTPICSGESLYTTRGYRPYFELRAMAIAMVDIPWNGFTESKKIADYAETYEINICPHNYYSHLSTAMSAHLCACVPNVRIMETEVEDVPWKDDIFIDPPKIEKGYLHIPDGPGWGVEINESELAKRPWQG